LDPIHGWIILVPVVYNTVAFLLGIGVLSQEYRKSHGIEREQTSLILTGLVVIFVIAYVFTAALARIFDTVEMGSPFNVIGCAIIVYGIVKYKLFVLPPLPRFFIPTPEERLRTKLKYRLREGRGYLVKERKPVRSAKIFVDQTRHGVPGLWITSLHPRKPCEEYGLSKTLVLSLTPDRITGEITVPPNKLGHARGIVSGYLSWARGRSVVMLDCFKELVVANGFERTMNFLKELAELCLKNNSNLIVQTDPAAFTKRQLVEIERALREEREKKR
jgi:fumarate reductase subunit D